MRNVHFEPWFADGAAPPAVVWGPVDRDAGIAGTAEALRSLAAFVGARRGRHRARDPRRDSRRRCGVRSRAPLSLEVARRAMPLAHEEEPMTHDDAIRLFAKSLQNLQRWMDKAAAHATARSFEVDVLAQARLAPDAFSFVQQVQSACDQAKYAAAYLSGKQPPSHPDTEQTFAELRQRITKCLGFLETVPARDLAGGEERKVSPAVARRQVAPRRRLPGPRRDPELLLPRDHGVRDPAPQRRRARQDGLHRLAAPAGGMSAV